MFICRDCGNKSSKKFPGGKCPACDSYNVKSTSGTREAIREKEPRTLVELVIMCVVWGLLAYGVWDRYLAHDDPVAAPAAPLAEPPLAGRPMHESPETNEAGL